MSKELPLSEKKIILTRSQDQLSESHILFEKKGADVYDLPSLIIGPPDDWRPVDDAVGKIDIFDWIIFSSANGVRNIEDRLNQLNLSLSEVSKRIKISAVGRKTANLLNLIGANISFVPPQFVADSVIQYFPEMTQGLKLFIPRVQSGGRSLLAESFRSKGAEVVEVAAYESCCPDHIPKKTLDALKKKNIDIITFTSGKTVINTRTLLTKYFGGNWLDVIKDIKIVSIGPQTSLSCLKNIRKPDKEAKQYDLDGLVKACIEID